MPHRTSAGSMHSITTFFSEEEGAYVLNEFLQRDGGNGVVLVMDPPFGGRVEPLAKTVREIMWLHRKLCPNSQTDMIGMCIFSAELLQNKFLLN